VLGEFLKQLLLVLVFWNVPHKKAVVVQRQKHRNVFALANLKIIELQIFLISVFKQVPETS